MSSKAQVNPVHHLIGTAAGWGGNPDEDAAYIAGSPAKNDGKTLYKMKVPAHVPVDAFWSVTAYDRQTHALIRNMPRASRSSQIPEMRKNADGSTDLVVRAVETLGARSRFVLDLPHLGRRIEDDVEPYRIRTWRVPADPDLPITEVDLLERPVGKDGSATG